MTVALNVGYSAENAVKEALVDLQLIYPQEARVVKEFRYMIQQIQLNMSVEQIFLDLAKRTRDEEVQMFATVLGLARRAGGDMVEIVRSAVWQIGEKIEVKQEIETMMAAKKMEFRIMSLVPFAMICYIKIAFPGFMNVMYGNLRGIVIMTICLLIYAAAFEWGRRMVEIEV